MGWRTRVLRAGTVAAIAAALVLAHAQAAMAGTVVARGCDPADASTDHTREHVPLLVRGPRVRPGQDLGARPTFADLGATLAESFGVGPLPAGTSLLERLGGRWERSR